MPITMTDINMSRKVNIGVLFAQFTAAPPRAVRATLSTANRAAINPFIGDNVVVAETAFAGFVFHSLSPLLYGEL